MCRTSIRQKFGAPLLLPLAPVNSRRKSPNDSASVRGYCMGGANRISRRSIFQKRGQKFLEAISPAPAVANRWRR